MFCLKLYKKDFQMHELIEICKDKTELLNTMLDFKKFVIDKTKQKALPHIAKKFI